MWVYIETNAGSIIGRFIGVNSQRIYPIAELKDCYICCFWDKGKYEFIGDYCVPIDSIYTCKSVFNCSDLYEIL